MALLSEASRVFVPFAMFTVVSWFESNSRDWSSTRELLAAARDGDRLIGLPVGHPAQALPRSSQREPPRRGAHAPAAASLRRSMQPRMGALQALANCQQAYDVLTADRSAGFFISPVKKREALEARAEAYMNDKNYDEAVNDLRGALELAGGDEKKQQEIQRRLQEAQGKATMWKCVDPEGDAASWDPHRCGHASQGNGRDHLAVLELPTNLPEVSQEKQCEWLKKQHKKHAIKWHPDKCKGNMQACTLLCPGALLSPRWRVRRQRAVPPSPLHPRPRAQPVESMRFGCRLCLGSGVRAK